jgi:hypothetical protein
MGTNAVQPNQGPCAANSLKSLHSMPSVGGQLEGPVHPTMKDSQRPRLHNAGSQINGRIPL